MSHPRLGRSVAIGAVMALTLAASSSESTPEVDVAVALADVQGVANEALAAANARPVQGLNGRTVLDDNS